MNKSDQNRSGAPSVDGLLDCIRFGDNLVFGSGSTPGTAEETAAPEETTGSFEKVNSGIPSMDELLDYIRLGDNVVFQVSAVEDYAFFVDRFVNAANRDGKKLIYIRFAQHRELVPETKAERFTLDPNAGFENFTVEVHQIIEREGVGAFYIFDCLSELQTSWAADLMMGNFFSVTCPYLYSLDTVAFFPLIRGRHSYETVARIRETTQLFLNVYSQDETLFLHPVKVWNRYSPNMFFPHGADRKEAQFRFLSDSHSVNRYYDVVRKEEDHDDLNLDSWERFFLKCADDAAEDDPEICSRLCRMILSDDERICGLFAQYFTKSDYLRVRERMIGTGKIGGKSCGILLARKIIRRKLPELKDSFEAHDSFYIGDHVFYTFLVTNHLWELRIRQRKKEGAYFSAAQKLEKKILKGRFPEPVRKKFSRILEYYGQAPLIVRSSSLLEDGFGNAFAGKYASVFCINRGTPEERLAAFEAAVKTVYASVMNRSALEYRAKRGLKDMDEQMAVLVQRVSGSVFGDCFFPSASGVGYSCDPWNWDRSVDAKRGMLRMVAGFATRVVERTGTDYPRIIHIDSPFKTTLVTQDEKVTCSQHYVDVIDLRQNCFRTAPIREIMEKAGDRYAELVCDRDTETEQKLSALGKNVRLYYGTCSGFAGNEKFMDMMERILATLQEAYRYPVDIEFTVNMNPDMSFMVCLNQCRPLQILGSGVNPQLPDRGTIDVLFAAAGASMGISQKRKIDLVVLVDSKRYHELPYRDKPLIAAEIGKLNEKYAGRGRTMMLIAPGRVGTSSPELGVPLRFSDLSGFSAIIEYDDAENGFLPELSFGSHLFQDFVESRIFYTALFSVGSTSAEFHREVLTGKKTADRTVSAVDVSDRNLFLWYNMVDGKTVCGFEK